MSPVGGGKPLFDLISSGRRPSERRPDAPRRSSREESDLASRAVMVPMIWIYAGAALLLVLIVGGYGIGYRLGIGSAREADRREAARDAEGVFVDDPLREDDLFDAGSDGGRGDRSAIPAGGTSRESDATSGGRPNGRSVATAGVLRGDGRVVPDPRREGVNYLELVTLPREKAIEAVRYLSENGEEAIAVPVDGVALDPGRRGSNNVDSFRVIALGLAVPGGNFKSSASARRRFEERLGRLGKAWTDEGGVSDFSDPLWRRFGG